jgi:hypothetical protein
VFRFSRRDLFVAIGILFATIWGIVSYVGGMRPRRMVVTVTEDIEFKAIDGIALRGTHYKVDGARAVCLFLHGITTSRDEYLEFHKRLPSSQ